MYLARKGLMCRLETLRARRSQFITFPLAGLASDADLELRRAGGVTVCDAVLYAGSMVDSVRRR